MNEGRISNVKSVENPLIKIIISDNIKGSVINETFQQLY